MISRVKAEDSSVAGSILFLDLDGDYSEIHFVIIHEDVLYSVYTLFFFVFCLFRFAPMA